MTDDLGADLRRVLSDAADGFDPVAPADMRSTLSATVRRRQRLQGVAVMIAGIAPTDHGPFGSTSRPRGPTAGGEPEPGLDAPSPVSALDG